MIFNENELRVVVDVDGTLIKPISSGVLSNKAIDVDYYGTTKRVVPMKNNIDLLKSYKKRGYEVTVHSANGVEWVKNVIAALSLTEYVDKGETKPLKYVDDNDANNWMQRVFVEEDL